MSDTKLAAPFKIYNERNDRIAEFNVHFDKNKNSFEKFLEFIDLYKDKRINVTFFGEFPFGVVSSINKISDNVYVRLTSDNFMAYKKLQEEGYRFFFDSSYPAYNKAMLDCLISMGSSDVYPADDLLYNLRDLRSYCDSRGVRTRVILNRIPSTTFDSGTNCKSQIYRPQDREYLDLYFDAYEFDCGKPYDWAKFDVLFRAWYEKEKWNGDLSEINDDLEIQFPNFAVLPELTSIKSNCERRCDSRAGNKCDKCEQYLLIGNDIANKGMYIKSRTL